MSSSKMLYNKLKSQLALLGNLDISVSLAKPKLMRQESGPVDNSACLLLEAWQACVHALDVRPRRARENHVRRDQDDCMVDNELQSKSNRTYKRC